MSPEAQRIAIAEAVGFPTFGIGHSADSQSYLPNYLHDLNAMHEAEQGLWHKDWLARDTFIDHLSRILNPWHGYRAQRGTDLLDATAAQRAEAFLKTIGKWEVSR